MTTETVELPPPPKDWIGMMGPRMVTQEEAREFARQAVLAERERCAKVCEDIYDDPDGNNGYDAYYTRPYLECAEAIRKG